MVRQGVGKSYGGVEWCLKVEDGGWNGSKAAARDGFGDGGCGKVGKGRWFSDFYGEGRRCSARVVKHKYIST